ncbi:hypothetical protein A9Q99_25750 [Gammaproteobacteria bacterium 45_16_T64]|nr:hypothetical protein A9Q99_25750 [Gammaproteobacteria bacterium 45_16_T64]
MPYKLTDKQFTSISKLSEEQRYDYFMRTVARWEEVWSLHSPDGWVELSVDDGQVCLPVWPHPDFAKAWAVSEWSDCKPKAIKLDVWLERWTPGLQDDDTVLAIFPVNEGEGVIETPEGMEKALLAELDQ